MPLIEDAPHLMLDLHLIEVIWSPAPPFNFPFTRVKICIAICADSLLLQAGHYLVGGQRRRKTALLRSDLRHK
jgi:hypothetical protein